MANESNLLSTPEGYATPAQLQSTREYAKALLQGNLQQPVHHWTQGVSNMVSALVGGNMDFNANKKQNESDAVRAGRMLPTMPGSPSTQPPPSFSGNPPLAGLKDTGGDADVGLSGSAPGNAPRGIRNNNPLNIEAGGFTQSQPGFAGSDGRFAKFEKPEQGVAAANALLDSYEHRGINTVAGIVNRWAPPGENDSGAYVRAVAGKLGLDPNAPVPRELRPQLIAAMGQHENGRPIQMAQNGVPPVAQEAATALRGGAKPPAGNGGGNVYPEAQNQPLINPALVQRRPQYSEGQMRGILADPTISEAYKKDLQLQYQNQDQPITMPYPGGNVIIDPRDLRRQQFIPDLQKTKKKLGDMEIEGFGTVGPGGAGGGGMQFTPAQQAPAAVGPRSEGTPPAAPAGGPTPAPPPVPVVAQNAPAAPTAAPAAVPNTGGVQVASNDPAAGAAAAAKAPSPFDVGAPALAAAPGAGPLAQFAQTKPPGATEEQLRLNNFAPQDVQDYTAKKAYEQQKALELKQGESDIGVKAEAQKKSNDAYTKKYDTMQSNAIAAAEQRNNVAMARKMTEDPNFYAGLGSGLVENWKKFKVAMGIDPNAAAPMEIFRKTTAQTIMSNLKTAFGGLGQIRVMEILLQKEANASTSNTPSAIKALLEITDRNAAKIEEIGKMSAAYKSGKAVVDPADPSKVLLPANPGGERVGLDSHWDEFLLSYYKDHPTFSREEMDKFSEDLKGRKGEKDVIEPASGEAKTLEATKPGMTFQGHLYKGGPQDNPNSWEEVAPKAKAK